MPIVFAGVTPHPPFLIPSIGKDAIAQLEHTKQALMRLEQDLYVTKPTLIMIISPHGSLFPEAFSLNAHTNFISSFHEFGDLVTKKTWKGSPTVAAKISHRAKEEKIPLQSVSQEQIDHGSSIPLFYLTEHLPDVQVLPVGYSALPAEKHLKFGRMIKEALHDTHHRVAIIASGDLSHEDKTYSEGVHPFDRAFIHAIGHDTAELLSLEPKAAEIHECGYRSALILFGILEHMDHRFEQFSYERPFGVGYLVGNFHV